MYAQEAARFIERDVSVGAEGFQLPSTLTLPLNAVGRDAQQVPCVILIHGSGPNDRDETIGPNKPFRDLAHGLAAHGIATLRYDKRTKVYGAASVPQGREMDYDTEAVDDAVAAVEQARTMAEICGDSVYVLGHSLGGTLAPRIAERAEGLAGIVILAGMVKPLEDAILEQVKYIASLQPSSQAVAQQIATLTEQVDNVKRLGTDDFDENTPLPLGTPLSYWLFAKAYKPVEVAARLTLPILILQGERDYQVTMEDYYLWLSGLWQHKNVTMKSYPKLNHLLQEGEGKSIPTEYLQAKSVASYVIDDIADFIKH